MNGWLAVLDFLDACLIWIYFSILVCTLVPVSKLFRGMCREYLTRKNTLFIRSFHCWLISLSIVCDIVIVLTIFVLPHLKRYALQLPRFARLPRFSIIWQT